ncbi:hypothetical protein [Pedobacter nyackensis]|uniref:Uncharacterized protein n=1 Tax=Pedobacter nyackensis TaxID=475255 RepID=A0A1W2AJK4_9SPHI|nr:hypothetical protein [Pedobacter nyackensis]SMC60621.1 hypothetical protein SAMN04488101_101652 [Pedobacter nyackensis]
MTQKKQNNYELLRVYRKAHETSALILKDFIDEYAGMEEVFTNLGYGEALYFKDVISIKSFRTRFRKSLYEECLSMDYLYFSPILIDTISRYYEGKEKTSSTLLGLALKNTLNFIWAGSYNNQGKDSRSYTSLKRIVSKSILYITLEQIIKMWEQQDLVQVSISNTGVIDSEIFWKLSTHFSLQGRHEYKVLNDAKKYIWENDQIDDVLEEIVMGIIKPKEAFKDSFLADIPPSQTSFWLKLWALRRILLISIQRNNLFSQDHEGLCLIPKSGMITHSRIPATEIQEAIYNCFWRKDWHREAIMKEHDILQRLIVERPCIRIRDVDNLFATSVFLLMDAINYCLESYIHKNDALYEKHFTKPFETQVLELLSKYGFSSGEVSEKGVWKNNIEDILFENKEKMPGQIDILALDSNKKQALLIDCKLIHFPKSANVLRNLTAKFDDRDTDGFHKKLEKKRRWLKGCDLMRDIEIINVHITNIYIPIFDSKKVVIPYSQLKDFLEKNYELL